MRIILLSFIIVSILSLSGCSSLNPFKNKVDTIQKNNIIDYEKDTQQIIDKKVEVNKMNKQDSSYRNIITVSILMLAASITLIFIYPTVGVPGAIAATSSILITILLQQFIFIVALIALGLFITLIIVFLLSILNNKKALKEIIFGIELVKELSSEEENEKLKEILKIEQSISTKKIVNKIKG